MRLRYQSNTQLFLAPLTWQNPGNMVMGNETPRGWYPHHDFSALELHMTSYPSNFILL